MHSSLNTYYEKEMPSLTRSDLSKISAIPARTNRSLEIRNSNLKTYGQIVFSFKVHSNSFFPINQHFPLRRRSMRSELIKISAIPAWTNRSWEMVKSEKIVFRNKCIHNFQFVQFDKLIDSIEVKIFSRTITVLYFHSFVFHLEVSQIQLCIKYSCYKITTTWI